MDKIQKLQQLRTSSLIGLLALVGLSAVLTGWILHSALVDQQRVEAYRKAELVSRLIQQQGLGRELDSDLGPKSGDRGPASTDTGAVDAVSAGQRDPWGRSYHWRWVDHGTKSFLVVWSSGPNGRNETQEELFAISEKGHLMNVEFAGDDVGFIRQTQ